MVTSGRAGEELNTAQTQQQISDDVQQRFESLYGAKPAAAKPLPLTVPAVAKKASTGPKLTIPAPNLVPPIILQTSRPVAKTPLVVYVDTPKIAAKPNDGEQVRVQEQPRAERAGAQEQTRGEQVRVQEPNGKEQVRAQEQARTERASAQEQTQKAMPPIIINTGTVAPPRHSSDSSAKQKRSGSKSGKKFATPKSASISSKSKKESRFHSVFIAIRDVFIAVALLFVVVQFISPTVVNEHSMEDTLQQRDILFVANKAFWFGEPKYDDIVIFHASDGEGDGEDKLLVKRMIGLPGDTISIAGGSVYRNGVKLDEPYTKDGTTEGSMTTVIVPEDSYFVLGDNRAVSRDSRAADVGFVSKDKLAGKIVFRAFPLTEFRTF